MRKAFAKRLAAMLLALCVAAALPLASAFAAEPAPAIYTITFSGGEYGQYSEKFVEKLEADYGEEDVVEQGNAVIVRLTSKEKLPALPTANDQLKSSNEAYNVMGVGTATMQKAGNTVDYTAGEKCASNYTLTPTFYLASETDVHYVLRFYVNGTEIEAAPAQYGIAPADTFVGGYPMDLADVPTPAEYTLNVAATVNNSNGAITQGTDGLVLTGANPDKGEYLTFTFYYDQITHVNTVTEYVDGDVVVNYNDVNLVGGAGVVGGGDGAGAGDGGEEIPDEETPQAGGEDIPDESTPQAGGEDIPDESTPQAGGESTPAGVSMPMVVGGVVGLLAILLIVLVALRKRKGGQEE